LSLLLQHSTLITMSTEQNEGKQIKAAIEAAEKASPDEVMTGLGPSKGGIYVKVRPEKQQSQYKNNTATEENDHLLLTYFALKGLGEVPRLMLAEVGAPYDHFVVFGGEEQDVAMEWRARSPCGLLPILSGQGIPFSSPLGQSGAIIHYLAAKFGMKGQTELEGAAANVLYETAKDMGGHIDKICAKMDDGEEKDMAAKLPFALALRVEKMLKSMPDPKDESSALNFGQMQLFQLLLRCEARRAGCVKENLSAVLDDFRIAMEKRPGIAAYFSSSINFPYTKGELDQEGGYVYTTPFKRLKLL